MLQRKKSSCARAMCDPIEAALQAAQRRNSVHLITMSTTCSFQNSILHNADQNRGHLEKFTNFCFHSRNAQNMCFILRKRCKGFES